LWARRSGLPDLRIKKPISGRPEIGAQLQLWIFSYTAIFERARVKFDVILIDREARRGEAIKTLMAPGKTARTSRQRAVTLTAPVTNAPQQGAHEGIRPSFGRLSRQKSGPLYHDLAAGFEHIGSIATTNRGYGKLGQMREAMRIHSKMLSSVIVVATALLVAGGTATFAQDIYPSRTIKIVVPLPAGPVADVLPRIVAEKLAAKWGQAVIIENRPGASLNIGAEAVARSEPDGYTLLATPPGPLVVSQHFFPKLGFDPTAFVPVTVMVKVPAVVVINPKVPVSTFQELIAFAKANPNKLSYGSPGIGNTPQLAMENLMGAASIRFVHVPYQGLGPAMNDLLAGHIDVMIDNLGNVMQHIASGRLKVLAATTETRIPELPDVPTVSETLPGVAFADWFAVVAPPKTSPEIATRLSQAIVEIIKLPDVAKRLSEFHLTPVGSSPAEAASLIKKESEQWRRIIAATGIKAN
jgi:tripartite-type tricarboxylate transporter receptor subunit TctC